MGKRQSLFGSNFRHLHRPLVALLAAPLTENPPPGARRRRDRQRLRRRAPTSCAPSRPTATTSCSTWKRGEKARTGIPNCACSSIRCTASTSSPAATSTKVPDDYRRRQTLKNAERFITPELQGLRDKALSARGRRWHAREMAVRTGARPTPAPHPLSPAWPRPGALDVLCCPAV